MWISLLLSFLLVAPAKTPVGTIAGSITTPAKGRITKPVQVVVFSGAYLNLYLSDLQRRLDNYWEDYKGAFIQDKEAFLIFRDRAQRQALDTALRQMRLDNPLDAATFVQTTTNNNFEFRNVPQGECRVVALVTVGNQEFVWSDSVILVENARAFITLKPTSP